MNCAKLAVLPLCALSLSATPLPFTATVDDGTVDIVGPDTSLHISSFDHFRIATCPVGVCQPTVDFFADNASTLSSINGVLDGLSFGPQNVGVVGGPPHVYGMFSINPTVTFDPAAVSGESLTAPATFLATIHAGSVFDLLFPGSGTALLGVEAPGIFSVGRGGTFSGFVEQVPEQPPVPEQAQIPEPAAWQLAGLGLLFPVWRRIQYARRSS